MKVIDGLVDEAANYLIQNLEGGILNNLEKHIISLKIFYRK